MGTIRIASRFAIAVHMLSLLASEEAEGQSSEWFAGSIGVNPVIVRNVTGMLRRAGLVHARQGVAGMSLARPLAEITLLDVYRAMEVDGELFAMHPNPSPDCPVGANIARSLDRVFNEAQRAMETRLSVTTMEQIVSDLQGSPSPEK